MTTQELTLTTRLNFGPAMSALTDKRRAFVVALNNAGGRNAAEAARAAGFSDGGGGARVRASEMLHDPNVQAAILEDARARLVGDLPATLNGIDQIATNPQHKDQLKALLTKLHHAGMIEKTMQQVDVKVTVTTEQKVEAIKQRCAELGLDPKDFLPANVIDAAFEEVTEPALW